ncbi:MAG: GNAT family N-acetyltransferase [Ahrensia sp.]
MAVTVRQESPLQDDVRTMVEELNAHMRPLSPPEFQFQLTAEQMAEPGVSVFVVRDRQGAAIGMGSLKKHSAELGEIKRMFTRPAIRGSGLGRTIIDAIEAKARELGLKKLVLETGSTPGFEPAWRVYERHGYTQCGAVLDYPDSEYNRFYEKELV